MLFNYEELTGFEPAAGTSRVHYVGPCLPGETGGARQ